jgi:benzoyl-CoA reductase/2-hydroxyglutaryl-CoA dehydratase subunit BcrC/BadD/HgdB
MDFSTLDKMNDLLSKRIGELKEAKENGQKIIGYFCCYIPEEILYAIDIIPIRLSRFGDNQVASVGATYLTANACPFARSCVGLKKGGKDEYFEIVDIVADAPACMQMRRVLEVWEEYFGTKVIMVSIPRQFYSKDGQEFFAQGLKQFAEELSELSGNKLTDERLKQSVDMFNNIRKLQRWMYDGLKDDSFALGWAQVLEVIRAGFVLDRKKYLDILNELKSEVEAATITRAPSKVRLLLAGGMLAPGDDKLIKVLDEVGGRVVMDELCTGSRGIYTDVEEPNIESIAKRYLITIPCGSLPYPRLEDDPRHAHLKNILKEYKITGILYYTLRFCDAYTFKVGHVREIANALKVKFLHINSDHSTADVHQIRTRVEAFVESIRELM